MTDAKLKNYIRSILTTHNKLNEKAKVPKLRFSESVTCLSIMDMPRELSKKQIEMIMEVTKGIDYKLIIQRGTDQHMMIIEKSWRKWF